MWPFRRTRKTREERELHDEMLTRLDVDITRTGADLARAQREAIQRLHALTNPPIEKCKDCGSLAPGSYTSYRFQDHTGAERAYTLCEPCDKNRKARKAMSTSEVLNDMLMDLTILEKGEVTEDELDYVRRSVLGES